MTIWKNINGALAQHAMDYNMEVTTTTGLPPWYGVVTSNTSEFINSMIDDYRSDGWTDLLEGILQKMTEKINENRQLYKAVDSDHVVNKVNQVLKDCFHSAAAMQVVELQVGQKYMVTETYGSTLNIKLNQQQTPPTTQTEHQQRHMPIPPAPVRVKANVLYPRKDMFLWKVAGIQVSL